MKVTIRGVKWKVVLLSEASFTEVYGDDCYSICESAEKAIYFSPSGVRLDCVIHELVHAYYDESVMSSATLTGDQVEECLADLFAFHGADMLKLSRKVFKWLKGSNI